METTKKKLSPKEAAEAMLRELVIKYGVKFMCDFEDVKRNNPLYVVIYELDGEISPSPMFPRLEVADTFVKLCRKYLPGFKEKNFKIYKLIAA